MTESITRPTITCQYWVVDEPAQCDYWDDKHTICTYKEEKVIANQLVTIHAILYPLCNYIGTAKASCYNYKSSKNPIPRCVLPDPFRHTEISPGCGKWVFPTTLSGTSDSVLVSPLDYSLINGYNNGQCNGDGTQVTCSGFSPQHLGFGIRPIPSTCTTISGIEDGAELPIGYVVANCRSRLGLCRWWDGPTDFILDTDDGKLTVKAPEYRCTLNKAEALDFSDFKVINEYQYQRPPCNGSMPDCPWYTGNIISPNEGTTYLSSIYTRKGDKVLAEQILELRYNLRKEEWTKESYYNTFDNPEIYAWEGTRPSVIYNMYNIIEDYTITSIRTYIKTFECFTIEQEKLLLTKGNESDNRRPFYPTLVKEIKDIPLRPIIRSVFDDYLTVNVDISNIDSTSWDDTEHVFETIYSDHDDILIVGDTFFQDNIIFAINLDDDSFVFDFPQILQYDSMHAIKASMCSQNNNEDYDSDSDVFSIFYSNLDCYIDFLQKAYPNKLYMSEFNGKNNGAFYIPVKTFFGENNIVVFDSSDGFWEYDKIKIHKYFCGGLLAQTKFDVITTDKKITTPVDTERFGLQGTFKYKIAYKFEPFILNSGSSSSLPVYTYFDTLMEKPVAGFNSNRAVLQGYSTYKIEVMSNVVISSCQIRMLGNHGYMLVIVDDKNHNDGCFCEKLLHKLIKPWEIEGDIVLHGTTFDGKREVAIPMEIYEYCTDRMEVNQLILRPVNRHEYRRIYNYTITLGEKIYVYERHSFNEMSDEVRPYTIVDADIQGNGVTIIKHIAKFSSSDTSESIMRSGDYEVTTVPIGPLVASVVFKGRLTNRIRGQVKSDLIVWLKKPYCSDVEIKYVWSSHYMVYDLLPKGYCFVSDIGKQFVGLDTISYTPNCGDHYFGTFTTRPSWMWYPYTDCDDYASYNIQRGSGEYDNAPMEFWLNEIGEFIGSRSTHGYYDLRMLGPSDNYGWTVDTHSHLWDCGCDYTHRNYYKTGNSWFDGDARIRTGINAEELWYVTRNGGKPPKFGNKHRDYLLSYRSNGSFYFIKVADGGDVVVDKKWCPAYETFYLLKLNKDYQEYPFVHYFNVNDLSAVYYNQLGSLVCSSEVDGFTVQENLVTSNSDQLATNLSTFGFDEVFRVHHTMSGWVSYPRPRIQYMLGDVTPKTIYSWYTYKDSPNSSDKTIHSAWRGNWRFLERSGLTLSNATINSNVSYCDLYNNYKTLALTFLDILYPNYTYDYKLKEHRRVCSEGSHNIVWEASIYSEDDPFRDNFFFIRLDDGPVRLLDHTLSPVLDSSVIAGFSDPLFSSISNDDLIKHVKFYNFCSTNLWLNDITSSMDLESNKQVLLDDNVFNSFMIYDSTTLIKETEEDAKKAAKDDGREILTTDGVYKVYNYYNRGLVINVLTDRLNNLPLVSEIITDPYEYNLSKRSDDGTDFSQINTSLFYPASTGFGMEYTSDNHVSFTFRFNSKKPVIVDKLKIVYSIGTRLGGPEESNPNDASSLYLFNIPKVVISSSVDGVTYTVADTLEFEFAEYSEDTFVEFKDVVYHLNDYSLDSMNNKILYLKIDFYYKPTTIQIEDAYKKDIKKHTPSSPIAQQLLYKFYYYTIMGMIINSVTIYITKFTVFIEQIITYERKFYISDGRYGDIPSHGKNNTGSLLYPQPGEPTVYQYDNRIGMVGYPNSGTSFSSIGKHRSRICGKVKEDKIRLNGSYIDYEKEQSKLYNAVLDYSTDKIILNSVAHVFLEKELKHVGVKHVARWTCELSNKSMARLKDVPVAKKYNPPGHKWYWKDDPDSIMWKFNCGGSGGHKWKKVFSYAWGRVSGLYNYVYESDIFDLFTYGIAKTISRWIS